jgi:hypothetical protein
MYMSSNSGCLFHRVSDGQNASDLTWGSAPPPPARYEARCVLADGWEKRVKRPCIAGRDRSTNAAGLLSPIDRRSRGRSDHLRARLRWSAVASAKAETIPYRAYTAGCGESCTVASASARLTARGRKPGNFAVGRRSRVVVGLRNSRKSGRQSCVARKFMNRL